MPSVTAYIGMGSNLAGTLANPKAQLARALIALDKLDGTRLVTVSGFYRSLALGPPQPDYVNAVACVETTLPPLTLLDQLQAIELAQHRVRTLHWGPRTLDLDLLLYGQECINLPRLKVPHPYLQERNFVLYPLATIAPDLVLPCGTKLSALVSACSGDGLTLLSDTES